MTIVTVGDNDVIGVISFTDLHLAATRADSVTHRGDRWKVVIILPLSDLPSPLLQFTYVIQVVVDILVDKAYIV